MNKKEPTYKSGYFYSKKNERKIKYRSSWELAIFQILENDKDVIRYEYEPIILFFHYKGKMKRYFPDLLIFYKNKTVLCEIKPQWKINKPTLYLKLQLLTAKSYSLRHGLKFEIWDWNEKENKIVKLNFPEFS